MGRRKLFFLLLLFSIIFVNKGKENSFPPEKNLLPYFEAKTFSQEETFQTFQNSFFVSNIAPVQIFPQNLATLQKRKEIIEYEVQKGDTISSIAQRFSLSRETILWANNLKENSILKVGQKLIILPVDGTLHQVKKGETLSEIAKFYKADLKEIISFNEIETNENGEPVIYPGEIYVIPGGKMPKEKKFVQKLSPLPSKFFICPLPPCRITQGLHWYNAVDFSNGKCGEYVLAAASGKVISVKRGWNFGGGNTVKILHPNGTITQYGHLREIFVKVGQEVFQGEPIGTVGGKPGTFGAGISTGCHLHFAVLGAKNPFAK